MRVTLDRLELLEALKKVGKAKRAPKGVQVSGLKTGALLPRLGGVNVEMPGGTTFVHAVDGALKMELEFKAADMVTIAKVLATFDASQSVVVLDLVGARMKLSCGKFSTSVSCSAAGDAK